VGEKSGQRALNIYSAVAAPFAAPKYSADVEDALRIAAAVLQLPAAKR
jgi:hypothetical protein